MQSHVFHEDVFYAYFRPFRHPASELNIWGGFALETFSKDLLIVRNYAENFVWTGFTINWSVFTLFPTEMVGTPAWWPTF